MRVFLDANILFSAAKGRGEAQKIVEFLLQVGHVLQIDRYVEEEARRNLGKKAVYALSDSDEDRLAVFTLGQGSRSFPGATKS